MNYFAKLGALACFLVLGCTGQAQLETQWTRVWVARSQFEKVVIDVNNNVYCLGRTFNPDALVLVKYNELGLVDWTYSITPGSGFTNLEPKGLVVDAAGASYILYQSGSSGSILGRVQKVSSSGAFLWSKLLENTSVSWVNFRPYGIHLVPQGKICAVYTRGNAFNLTQWRYVRFTSDGTVDATSGATSSFSRGVANDSVMTNDGRTILRFGRSPEITPAATATIQANPPYAFPITMPYATQLAYTPAGGGYLYGMGRLNTFNCIIYRASLTNGATVSQTFVTDPSFVLGDLTTDPEGRLITVSSAGTTQVPIITWTSHSLQNLISYSSVYLEGVPVGLAADRFGSILTAIHSGNLTMAQTRLMDAVAFNGFPAYVEATGYEVVPAQVGVNSRGFAAVVGKRRTNSTDELVGYVSFLRQTGLLNVTLPLAEYTGGQSATATVRRYVSDAKALEIAFASDSSFATVPPFVTIPTSASSVTASITLSPTAVDRFVTLEARDSGRASDLAIIRRFKFILKAPRPTSLVLAPASLRGGANSTATVTMNGIAPSGGVRLTLASNNAFAVVPATALVPINQNRVNFTITTTRPTSTQTATISATYIGVTRSATLTILP